MNINDVKQNYRIEEVIGRTVSLKRQGPEMVGNCIFHNDDHASMKVNPQKQIFKCFACGAGRDMVDFFTLQGHSIDDALQIITNGTIVPSTHKYEKQVVVEWRNAVPDQSKLPDVANLTFKDYGKPSMFWTYHNAQGQITGYTLRFDLPEGKKDVIPYTYKTDGTESRWRWQGFDLLRPLYNLHELTTRPHAIVLVVEGEKAADAARRLFPQYVAVSWIGGKDNVNKADWNPLKGRNVYLWADNDLAGILAMFGGWDNRDGKSAEYVRFKGVTDLVEANFKRIANSPEFPKKWDIADATWTPDEAAKYLKANRTEIPVVSATPPNETHAPAAIPEIPIIPIIPKVPPKPVQENSDQPQNPYFKCLGFENNDQNLYVFFVYRTNVIVKLSAGGINTANLLQLAPLNHWEGQFPKTTRTSGPKFEINQVADFLISICSRLGIFNPDKIRGRGAWTDNGRAVIHLGDTLIVDGQYTPFGKLKSKFIYEAGQELNFSLVDPLNKAQAYKLITLLERLNWGREINARLLAGWIVIAPLCGALHWRPHLWLTGASGTGKSWIMNNIIKKFLGEMFVDSQSETTEAGIRQVLKADAMPVVFDEAESEDRRAFERMQSVLNIMRASSTSDGGKIIKGSAGGAAAMYQMRSCFAFASIGANLTQRSDISRISVLEVKKDDAPDKKEKWTNTLHLYHNDITSEYIQAFQSRAVLLLPTILANAKTFSAAAAMELDNQRAGDQLGALLAGAFSLTSERVISLEDAKAWIKERDWSEERLQDATRDEVKVLNKIMNAETIVESQAGRITRTIGELVIIARGDVIDYSEALIISEKLAEATLRRIGLRVERFNLIISDTSEFIAKVLAQTPYAKNYHTILARVDRAEKIDGIAFGAHIKTRATKIDTRVIFGEDFENPGASQTELDLHKK